MVVFRWDIDKTYLDTEFETISGLIRTATEKASEKKAIEGARNLLRALQQYPESSTVFISGSPKQMKKVLLKKFALDGIEVDDIVLKDSLEAIRSGHLRDLTQQVGYKLPGLVESRLKYSLDSDEYLFGDNVEEDALVYLCYALIVSQAISIDDICMIMARFGAYERSQQRLIQAIQQLNHYGRVRRIFIRLADHQLSAKLTVFAPLVVAVHDWLQAAMVLWEDGILSDNEFQKQCADRNFSTEQIANLAQDLQRRGCLSEKYSRQLYHHFGVQREIFSIPTNGTQPLDGQRFLLEVERLWSH